MPHLTTAEKLLYSTVKLTTSKAGVPQNVGTGFFVQLAGQPSSGVPVIITNKHVLKECDEVTAIMHLAKGDQPSGQFVSCSIGITGASCILHPNVDLCAVFLAPTIKQVEASGSRLYFQALPMDIVPKDEDWQYFDAIEDVTMIGCPRGISDEFNNFPIVRRGITASSLARRYNDKDEFMVDMACFPGSSGSPIFIYNRDGFLDRRDNSYYMGRSRTLLVGVLFGGPTIANDGRIVFGHSQKIEVASMMHLGNAIRASALNLLDAEVRNLLAAAAPG